MDAVRSNLARIAAVLIVVFVAGLFGLLVTGTQVSKILSTVGSSVGVPDGGGNGADDVGADGPPAAGQPDGADGGAAGDGEAVDVATLTSIDRPDLLVVKTGKLSLRVASVDAALESASEIVRSLGGYEAGSDRSGDAATPEASVTFRIPAAGWEAAMSRLRGLAEQVLDEHSSTEDVTGKVVDLGARITNLQATERALQQIMDRAGAIKDVLSVQQELTKVRGQIEELSADRTHLQDQAAFSTLEVTFSLKPPDPVKIEQAGFDPSGEVDRASASLIGILQDLAVVGIWFGIVWLPILVVLLALAGIGWFVARRVRHAASDGGGAGPAAPLATGADGAA